jgi:hypothetical protein
MESASLPVILAVLAATSPVMRLALPASDQVRPSVSAVLQSMYSLELDACLTVLLVSSSARWPTFAKLVPTVAVPAPILSVSPARLDIS